MEAQEQAGWQPHTTPMYTCMSEPTHTCQSQRTHVRANARMSEPTHTCQSQRPHVRAITENRPVDYSLFYLN